MQLLGVFFSTFCGQKKSLFKKKIYIFAHKKLKKPPQKVTYLWQLGFFFSAALTGPNSPELQFRFINSFIQPSLVGSLDSAFDPCPKLQVFHPLLAPPNYRHLLWTAPNAFNIINCPETYLASKSIARIHLWPSHSAWDK